jgi:hypothetical protein
VRGALADAGVDDISFAAEISPDGSVVLHLLHPSPAAEPGIGNPHPGSLILVEDAVPEPWRRLPEPVPRAVPAPSVDLASLERIPDAIGATEAEIAAAEVRLGVVLPDELKVLYGVPPGTVGGLERRLRGGGARLRCGRLRALFPG